MLSGKLAGGKEDYDREKEVTGHRHSEGQRRRRRGESRVSVVTVRRGASQRKRGASPSIVNCDEAIVALRFEGPELAIVHSVQVRTAGNSRGSCQKGASGRAAIGHLSRSFNDAQELRTLLLQRHAVSVQVYTAFKDVGISLDQDRTKWLSA